jgi:hypothetical protein
MTASSWKWVLLKLVDELIHALCSYVPTAPLTVQHSNCSCKSNYFLTTLVYFLKSFLHDDFLFLKTDAHTQLECLDSIDNTFKMSFIYA